MGKRLKSITAELREFVEQQPVFFVATAPEAADGHVNLSPKGLDTFRVLDESRIAYLDLTGSGNETAAHITENGRLTIMFCAFTGRPQIVRLYCRARAVLPGSIEWASLIQLFPEFFGARQIILGEVEFANTSCGYGVPEMRLEKDRDTLPKWAVAKGAEGIVKYREEKNRVSIDGLPAPFSSDTGSN